MHPLIQRYKTDIEHIFKGQPCLINGSNRDYFLLNEQVVLRNLKTTRLECYTDQIVAFSTEEEWDVEKIFNSFEERTIEKAITALHFQFENTDYILINLTEDKGSVVVANRLYLKEDFLKKFLEMKND